MVIRKTVQFEYFRSSSRSIWTDQLTTLPSTSSHLDKFNLRELSILINGRHSATYIHLKVQDWKNRKDTECLFENIEEKYLHADLLLSVNKLPEFVTPWEGPCNFTDTKAPCFPQYNKTQNNFGEIIFPTDLQKEFYVRSKPFINILKFLYR